MCSLFSRLRFLFIIFIIILVISNNAYSQPVETNVDESNNTEEIEQPSIFDTANVSDDNNEANIFSSNNTFFTMIVMLFLIIIVIYFIIRRVMKKRNVSFTVSDFAKIEGTKALALNKFLQLVNIEDKYYLLGVGDNVNLITEITDKEHIDKIKINLSKSKPLKSFIDQFKSYFIGKNKKSENINTKNNINSGGSYTFSEKLEENIEIQKEKNIKINENNNNQIEKQSENNIAINNLLKNFERINNNDELRTNSNIENLKKSQGINEESEKEDNYDLNFTDDYDSISDKKDLSKNDDLISDSNFEFIKKQRERLANLGIDIDFNSK